MVKKHTDLERRVGEHKILTRILKIWGYIRTIKIRLSSLFSVLIQKMLNETKTTMTSKKSVVTQSY